jgi:prolipoprotein diacylglyceryltransferase/protein-S-isoprenylcysteine O-methyltransferase Ste14
MKNTIGKFLYALLFLVIIPLALWYWAAWTDSIVRYPAIESEAAGWVFSISGGLLMLWGMLALRTHGKGLPMNSFPPPQFVTQGPYRLFRHPIYWGFGMLLVGVFILKGSASGLWLVTPITILGMMGLVWGYEKIDLKQRFPDSKITKVLDLPDNDPIPASLRDRLASAFWVITLLALSNYIATTLIGNTVPLTGSPLNLYLLLDNVYLAMLGVLFIAVAPFLLRNKDLLREWAHASILGLFLSLFLALVAPVAGVAYLPDAASATILPVFTAVPIFLILISFQKIVGQTRQRFLLLSLLAVLLSLMQLHQSRSALLHLTTSIGLFLLAANYKQVWFLLKNLAEKIANSWQEWVFGKIRVINHGFYVGAGTFLSILLAGALSGKLYAWAILVFAVIGIVSAALWAQIIEGSEKLKRPFGYYGSLVGIPFACLAFWAMGVHAWVIIAVVSVVMPWAQAIGRLRCLVNGCCHGGPVNNPDIGIRYFHVRSRVCGLSGLKGVLLHPTQLYAIIWLFFVGFILLALWINHFPASFIFGLYLILTGLGRFVEEAYRGEVQTAVLKGLRLYQWAAILSVFTGIVMTVIPSEQVLSANSGLGWETLTAAVLGGFFACFAMGIDFPYSNRRFSRLV